MHRSRMSVLVIFAAAAACSKSDDSSGTELLSQDRALVARLEVAQETPQLPLPSVCGTVTVAAQPTVGDKQQADALTQQAMVAQMHGNEGEASSLLRRASELDATNKPAAYHLGRTSEALGDRAAATTAYCRYLALTPSTAESVEARQRVEKLSNVTTRVAAGSVTESAPTARPARVATATRATRARSTVEPRFVRRAPAARSETVTASSTGSAASDAASTGSETSTSTDAGGTGGADGSVVATSGRPTADRPASASSSSRRGPSRAQSAGIGAATGAIIGAATGRSVKSAVIGGAAGGILGAMVGGRGGFVGRGIVP